jgi:formylglycine-generating enzyme required for sulfatase activity
MAKSLKLLLWIALLAAVGVALYIFKVSWYERYVWPESVDHMQELPPADRSGWPGEPVAWERETQPVEVATPGGLQVKDITYYTNTVGMDFVRIEAGAFQPVPGFRSLPDKWPLRRASRWRQTQTAPQVTLSRPFFLGAFEVTNLQYELFDPTHKERRPDYQQGRRGDYHPVEPITWQQAQRYARWLSQKEGRIFRLPTEAEWEYAAMAGTNSRLYWGQAFWDRSKANLGGLHSSPESYGEDGYEETAPVGMFPANPWGLYDMVGNSYEWVQDWWHPNATEDVTDPTGPAEGRIRMGKGGSWTTRVYAIYTGEDDGNNPADLRDSRGFRLLVEIE